jgi:hypothetical protein
MIERMKMLLSARLNDAEKSARSYVYVYTVDGTRYLAASDGRRLVRILAGELFMAIQDGCYDVRISRGCEFTFLPLFDSFVRPNFQTVIGAPVSEAARYVHTNYEMCPAERMVSEIMHNTGAAFNTFYFRPLCFPCGGWFYEQEDKYSALRMRNVEFGDVVCVMPFRV